jgi:small subunit ribosomal protein S7
MADKFTASASQLKEDHRTHTKLASKFINCLMHDGKKSVAMKLFYDAMDIIVRKMPDDDAVRVFTEAVENVRPSIEVRSKRVGGATSSRSARRKGVRRTSVSRKN